MSPPFKNCNKIKCNIVDIQEIVLPIIKTEGAFSGILFDLVGSLCVLSTLSDKSCGFLTLLFLLECLRVLHLRKGTDKRGSTPLTAGCLKECCCSNGVRGNIKVGRLLYTAEEPWNRLV